MTVPTLSLAQLDTVIGTFVVRDYHQRVHSETGEPPQQRWLAGGWLPRMPASLEQLDLLLLTLTRPRVVHRDGIHCHGLRYLDLTLSAYVGERVTVRYDPRDLAEIRLYYQDDSSAAPSRPNSRTPPSPSKTFNVHAPGAAGNSVGGSPSAAASPMHSPPPRTARYPIPPY